MIELVPTTGESTRLTTEEPWERSYAPGELERLTVERKFRSSMFRAALLVLSAWYDVTQMLRALQQDRLNKVLRRERPTLDEEQALRVLQRNPELTNVLSALELKRQATISEVGNWFLRCYAASGMFLW